MEDLLYAVLFFAVLLGAAAFRRGLGEFHARTGIHPLLVWLGLMVVLTVVVMASRSN